MRDTVSLIHTAADGTCPRGVPGVHQDYRHSPKSRLVLDKATELKESPRVVLSPLAFLNPDPRTYALKVFQGDRSIRAFSLQHHPFADVVVHPGREAAFLSTPLTEQPLGSPTPLGLKPSPEFGVSFPESVDLPPAVSLTIGVGQDVDDAQVNTQHILSCQQGRFLNIHNSVEIENVVSVHQVGFANPVGQHLSLSRAASIGDNLPPLLSDSPNGYSVVREISHNAVIVGNGAVWPEGSQGTSVQLISVGGFGNAPDGHLRCKGEVLADGVIAQLVELVLAEDLLFPGEPTDLVAGGIGLLDGLEQSPMLVRRGQQFQVNDQLHTSSIEHSGSIGLGVLLFWLLKKQGAAAGQHISNAETWEWVDAEGHNRTITVHRDVRSS